MRNLHHNMASVQAPVTCNRQQHLLCVRLPPLGKHISCAEPYGFSRNYGVNAYEASVCISFFWVTPARSA